MKKTTQLAEQRTYLPYKNCCVLQGIRISSKNIS